MILSPFLVSAYRTLCPSGPSETPADVPVCVCTTRELNNIQTEARQLRSALISVTAVFVVVIIALSVALVVVCVLWRRVEPF